jgi:hypothetical protein
LLLPPTVWRRLGIVCHRGNLTRIFFDPRRIFSLIRQGDAQNRTCACTPVVPGPPTFYCSAVEIYRKKPRMSKNVELIELGVGLS